MRACDELGWFHKRLRRVEATLTCRTGPPAHLSAAPGYCFVNFLDAADAGRLHRKYHNQRWEEYNSKKARS